MGAAHPTRGKNQMDKETTPQTYAAWKASIDDTGCVCRMESIWETMTCLEKDLASLQRRLEMALEVCNDRIKETEAAGDLEWTERNKHVARILSGILKPNKEARDRSGSGSPTTPTRSNHD